MSADVDYYVCPQCGPTSADAETHTILAHTLPIGQDEVLQEILQLTRATREDAGAIRKIVEDIAPEIKPTLEAILDTPIVKFMVGRKRV